MRVFLIRLVLVTGYAIAFPFGYLIEGDARKLYKDMMEDMTNNRLWGGGVAKYFRTDKGK